MKSFEKNITEHLTFKQLMYIEVLIASLLPVTALLLVGAVGTQYMQNRDATFFIVVFLLCAVAIALGEYTLLSRIHHAIHKHFVEITNVCRDFLAGEKERRILVQGNSELATLASTINALLEQQQRTALEEDVSRQKETILLSQQLERLVTELAPIADGDLRIKITPFDGPIGTITDVCDLLVEVLVEFTIQTRSASEQMTNASQNILNRLVEMTETVETQLLQLSQIIHILEHDSAPTAESIVENLTACVQRIQQFSAGILMTAEDVRILIILAEQLGDATKLLQLPEGSHGPVPGKQPHESRQL